MFQRRPSVPLLARLAVIAACFAATAWSQIPPATRGTTPASTSTSSQPATRAIQADDILANFPANTRQRLTTGQRITIEGRVLEVREPRTKPAASTRGTTTAPAPALHVILVGSRQKEDNPAHITCTIDPAAEEAARNLRPGVRVRISGIGAGVVPEGDRVDFTACHDIAVLPGSPVEAADLTGQWDGTMIQSAAALAPWRTWVTLGDLMGAIQFTLRFAADGAMTMDVRDTCCQRLHATGTWKIVNDPANGPQIYTELKAGDNPFQGTYFPIICQGSNLQLGGPSKQQPAAFAPSVNCSRPNTEKPKIPDSTAVATQFQVWLKANITLPNPATLIEDSMKSLATAAADQRPFVASYGSGLTKSKETTQVSIVRGKLLAFELTGTQATASGIGAGTVQSYSIRSPVVPMTQEIKIDSLSLDNHNALSMARGITGVVTLRALHQFPSAHYFLTMESQHGVTMIPLEAPGADDDTIPFKIAKLGPVFQSPNPILLFFTITRDDPSTLEFSTGRGNDKYLAVSPTLGILVDVVP